MYNYELNNPINNFKIYFKDENQNDHEINITNYNSVITVLFTFEKPDNAYKIYSTTLTFNNNPNTKSKSKN